jgi:LmbE family N-acetylglucosaminyl deacetylase
MKKTKKKQQNIIVFCAHSDDQILGPGGTLAKYAEEKKHIYTVIFSYGEEALPHYKKKVAVETRVKEAKKANEIIGGKDVYFFGLKEGKFAEEIKKKDILKKIKRVLLEKRPEKIFTHSPEDAHPDHREVLKAVLEALDKSRLKSDVYSFEVWNILTFKKSHLPRLYIDISNTIDKKINALKAFPSQKASILPLYWNVMVRSFIHGLHLKKSRYAERFFKIR